MLFEQLEQRWQTALCRYFAPAAPKAIAQPHGLHWYRMQTRVQRMVQVEDAFLFPLRRVALRAPGCKRDNAQTGR